MGVVRTWTRAECEEHWSQTTTKMISDVCNCTHEIIHAKLQKSNNNSVRHRFRGGGVTTGRDIFVQPEVGMAGRRCDTGRG